jgi:hypothetical protein
MLQPLHIRETTVRIAVLAPIALAFVTLAFAGPARAQEADTTAAAGAADSAAAGALPADTLEADRRIRVFLDCQRWLCDFDYLREEVPYVDYVRNRQASDVQVLVTVERTGGGGGRFTLDFIGRNQFEGVENRVNFQTSATTTDAQRRESMTRHIQLGLAAFAARTGLADQLRVTYEGPGREEREETAPADDPWNLWVFRTSIGGSLSGEEARTSTSLRGGISANRTTRNWKWDFGLNGSYSESNFDIRVDDGGDGDGEPETRTITSIRRRFGFDALGVRSVGSHWGVGAQFSADHSTFSNYDLALRAGPALEYNIFPYEESTRRQLTFLYALTLNSLDYLEETIFFQTHEVRPRQSLTVSLDLQEPWGEAGMSVEAGHFFHDLEKNRLTVDGDLEVELWGGFSVNLRGEWSRVRDQLNLPAGGASEEEVLLRQRELATDFEYDVSVGHSYTFGSIFSSVVDTRFGELGGGERF